MGFIPSVNAVLDKYASLAKNDLDSPMETWETHAGSFSITSENASNILSRLVSIRNEQYYWLNWGTSVRHAVLSRDWRSKTKVKVFGGNTGAGKVLFVSKSFSGRGITARLWTQVVVDKYREKFVSDMQAIATEYAKKAVSI